MSEKWWDKTKDFAEDLWEGAVDLFTFEKDLPRPIGPAQEFLKKNPGDMVSYYEMLKNDYEALLAVKQEEIVKYEAKLRELKDLEDKIHDEKIETLASRPKIRKEIDGAKNDSKFFEEDSYFDEKYEGVEKDKKELEKTTATLPDEDPLVKDTDNFVKEELYKEVPSTGSIKLKLYFRLVKSKLTILEREEDELEEQFERSKYWYNHYNKKGKKK